MRSMNTRLNQLEKMHKDNFAELSGKLDKLLNKCQIHQQDSNRTRKTRTEESSSENVDSESVLDED